ncbi:MAG TPA: peptidylprolyl isomerase [Geminicoccus sp.]|uniref:peptidylprolyl isomerase n=1 Tax=Geminicoccus sp. TaxID=2024832 RepID=UPI002E3468BB|nr:peptidylprolyl isomerase [Geminicoccus sp.]HEX2525321.1 peptidylprolyl isomerase [Geminicoccus sp.]
MRLAVFGLSILLATTSLVQAQETTPAPAGDAANQATTAPAADPVVATVNGSPIHRSEVLRFQESLPEQYRTMPLEMVFEPLLNRVIDTRLLAAKAEQEGIASDPAVEAKVTDAQQAILRDEILRRAVDQATSSEALQKAYDEAKAQPDFALEEARAAHILVETPEAASEVIARLDKGETFAEVAKSVSKDPGSAEQGGELGWFTRDKMVPEFSAAAFTMEPGSYSKEPIKSQFGYHVILLEEKRTREPSIEEMREALFQQGARQAIEAVVADVREGVTIEKFNPDGSAPAPAGSTPPADVAPAAPAQ